MTASFPMPPEGMFTEQRDFLDLALVLGLMHPDSADGVRVVAWDGENLRHMTSEAARKWAAGLIEDGHAKLFAAVIEAIRDLADSADARNAAVSAAKYAPICRSAARKAMAKLTASSEVAGRA